MQYKNQGGALPVATNYYSNGIMLVVPEVNGFALVCGNGYKAKELFLNPTH